MKALERIRGALAKKTATEIDAAKKQAELLSGVSLKFTRKTGENDQMFGSVTTGDIADGLNAQGFHIDKRQVQLADPLKTLGEFPGDRQGIPRRHRGNRKSRRRKRSLAIRLQSGSPLV